LVSNLQVACVIAASVRALRYIQSLNALLQHNLLAFVQPT